MNVKNRIVSAKISLTPGQEASHEKKYIGCNELGFRHRRRIKTEEKAKGFCLGENIC